MPAASPKPLIPSPAMGLHLPVTPVSTASQPAIDKAPLAAGGVDLVLEVHRLALLAVMTLSERPADSEEIATNFRLSLTHLIGPSDNSSEGLHLEKSALLSFYSLTPLLKSNQYALPQALHKTHPKLLEQLTSAKGNDMFEYSGLLLYGPQGTGKSEYIRYLGSLVSNTALVVTVNCAAIRNSNMPATELQRLYGELQAIAEKEGKYIVAFLDEFDIFMTQHSTIKNSTTHNVHSGEKGMNSSSQTNSEVTLDEVGSQLFATIKHIMSGSGTSPRVFTIATTNEVGIPAALTRGGRFEGVELHFPFPCRDPIDYRLYGEYLVTILEIFTATHCRIFDTTTPPKELTRLMQQARKLKDVLGKIQPKTNKKSSNPYASNVLNLTQQQWELVLNKLMDFFNIPEGEVRSATIRQTLRWHHQPIITAGERSKPISQLNPSSLASTYKALKPTATPEISQILELCVKLLFR